MRCGCHCLSGLRSSKGAIFGTGEQGIDEKHQGDFLRAVCSLEAKEELEALVREVAGCLGFLQRAQWQK